MRAVSMITAICALSAVAHATDTTTTIKPGIKRLHRVTATQNINVLIVDLFIDNLRRYLDDQPMRNVFDRSRAY